MSGGVPFVIGCIASVVLRLATLFYVIALCPLTCITSSLVAKLALAR